MNLTEIKKSLDQLFEKQPSIGAIRNIIFWYDENGAFADDIDNLELANAKIIKLDNNNMFATKLYIERTDRESNLLVYSNVERPKNDENWLTDTIKYSQTFSADEVSLILLNFGMDNTLKSTVSKYKQFFLKYKTGYTKFEGYALTPYSENKIHLGVLSALCKLPAPNLDNVVRTLIIEMVQGESTAWDYICKYGNEDVFWGLIKDFYGYNNEEKSFDRLAILLMCSHLAQIINTSLPKDWLAYVSENPNCFVFVDNFMKNNQLWEDYNAVATFVADKLGLQNIVKTWTIDEIANCDTFPDFDYCLINRIRENITLNSGEYGFYRKIINSRRNRRYYRDYVTEYATLLYACEYLELAVIHRDLPSVTAKALFDDYVNDYCKLDSAYRHFLASHDGLVDSNDYTKLFEMVEYSYTNWFLSELTMKWNTLWDDEEKWTLTGITPQQSFYDRYARKFVYDDMRIIVIISDGLRYESAVELNSMLNREFKAESKLEPMFGVIPSYTALGMASLLPRKNNEPLVIKDNATYQISGISTKGTENRGKILSLVKKESIAINYKELGRLNKQEIKEKFSEIKLIYIYHDTIDAVGDNAKTEDKVFNATNDAFREISGLVRRLCNEISAINIVITADHGYIYRRTKLEEHDKTPKADTVAIKSSRRFLLAREEVQQQGTQSFPMSYLTKSHNDIVAILPKGSNCFKIKGYGDRYVRGGASLQEVVIPVITFKSGKNIKGSKSAKKVAIGVTSISQKVTSVITHLTFFQNEPVDDKHLPLRVIAYFEDENGERISNENIIIADSVSSEPRDREYKEKFTLKSMAYDKAKKYFLVLVDEEETVNKEINRIPFIIDLVFGSGIQF